VQTFFKTLLVNSNTEILHRYFESFLNMNIKVPFVKVFFAVIQSISSCPVTGTKQELVISLSGMIFFNLGLGYLLRGHFHNKT